MDFQPYSFLKRFYLYRFRFLQTNYTFRPNRRPNSSSPVSGVFCIYQLNFLTNPMQYFTYNILKLEVGFVINISNPYRFN